MDMVSCALSSLSLFTFLSHFTSMFHLTRIFHTCLSSALILMLAVTIATTFRVLPNKPGVTPSRSAAGLERTTTKDHNVCVCVCVCVCAHSVEVSPPTERENSGRGGGWRGENQRQYLSQNVTTSIKQARNMSVPMRLYLSVHLQGTISVLRVDT